MFARGATPEKVKMWCYDEDEEDFTKGSFFNCKLSFFFFAIRIAECHDVYLRCDCFGYVGSGSTENTLEERDDGSSFRFSTSFRESNIFSSLTRTRYYRTFV